MIFPDHTHFLSTVLLIGSACDSTHLANLKKKQERLGCLLMTVFFMIL